MDIWTDGAKSTSGVINGAVHGVLKILVNSAPYTGRKKLVVNKIIYQL